MIARLAVISTLVLAACIGWASESHGRELYLTEAIQLVRVHAPQLAASQAAVAALREHTRSIQAERMGTLTLTSSANYISELSQLTIAIPNVITLEREIGSHETYQNDLRLTVPLWTGGRLGSSIKLASLNESIAAATASADTLRLVYQTHLEYFNLAAATEGVRIADVTLTRVRNLQTEVRDLHAAGSADSLAIIEADLAVNRATLQQEQATDIRRRSEIRLLQLCGLPVQEELSLSDSLANPVPLAPSGSVDSPNVIARPELLAARKRIGLAEFRSQLQRAEYLPTLGAYAGYAYGQPNLDSFGNSWNDNWSAGAQLQWSINIGGKNSHTVRRTQFEQSLAQSDYIRIQEGLTTEQLLSRERTEIARSSFATQQKRAQLRASAFRLSQIQFCEGILPATRLFDAEQLLGEAELSAALTLIEWYAARSAFWYAIGAPELLQGI